uniref:Uncharacterized protein n=1 Tax=Lepeophtheirus salmonis TaxID=72036 RepID=A0A0K2UYK4_LEPSM
MSRSLIVLLIKPLFDKIYFLFFIQNDVNPINSY